MIISNPVLIAGLGVTAGTAFAGRLLLARRELQRKNQFGLLVFETFLGLALHRTLKALSSLAFVLAMVGAGAAYLFGLDLLVEDGFAVNVLRGAVGAVLLTLVLTLAVLLRKKRGRAGGGAHPPKDTGTATATTHDRR